MKGLTDSFQGRIKFFGGKLAYEGTNGQFSGENQILRWGELNSSVVNRLMKGLTDRFRLGRFSGLREKFGGELNFSMVERLDKGLTSAWSPTRAAWSPCGRTLSVNTAARQPSRCQR
eukprot:3871350-Pyramimonas_sp.AAC.1